MENTNEQANISIFLREKWQEADKKLLEIRNLINRVQSYGGNLVYADEILEILDARTD